jgi:hypothetical protein
LAVGATILILGIGGAMGMPNGMYPFQIPVVLPQRHPGHCVCRHRWYSVERALPDPPAKLFGVEERTNINL